MNNRSFATRLVTAGQAPLGQSPGRSKVLDAHMSALNQIADKLRDRFMREVALAFEGKHKQRRAA